jgi:hypothetical protein
MKWAGIANKFFPRDGEWEDSDFRTSPKLPKAGKPENPKCMARAESLADSRFGDARGVRRKQGKGRAVGAYWRLWPSASPPLTRKPGFPVRCKLGSLKPRFRERGGTRENPWFPLFTVHRKNRENGVKATLSRNNESGIYLNQVIRRAFGRRERRS